MNTATITLGSVTYAIKSRKVLAKNGIRSKLVKLDSSKTTNGCNYGLEILRTDFYSAVSILRNEQINYELYRDG